MKKPVYILICLLCAGASASAQTLTLVTGKRLYEHHSSSLSNNFYGYYNININSGYDFVNHMNRPSGAAAQANNRDLVEYNGPFGTGITWTTYGFGFTDSITNIGNFTYAGNMSTRYFLNPNVTFASLNTVNDLVAAYNPGQSKAYYKQVAVGDIYIAKIRNTDMYVAMTITNVSNLSQAQMTALVNQQDITADVYFDFDYKYGTLAPPVATGITGYSAAHSVVELYPNPAGVDLFISGTGAFSRYRILTLTGAEAGLGSTALLSGGAIDVSALNPGIYFLELSDGAGVLQRNKFIKE
jgi:hypothetical protein